VRNRKKLFLWVSLVLAIMVVKSITSARPERILKLAATMSALPVCVKVLLQLYTKYR